jgi:hypothetical protein
MEKRTNDRHPQVEFPHLGVEQVVKEEPQKNAGIPARVFFRMAGWNTRPPLLGFLAGHNRPTDGLGVGEDPGLDGFVFSGCGHDSAF